MIKTRGKREREKGRERGNKGTERREIMKERGKEGERKREGGGKEKER